VNTFTAQGIAIMEYFFSLKFIQNILFIDRSLLTSSYSALCRDIQHIILFYRSVRIGVSAYEVGEREREGESGVRMRVCAWHLGKKRK
jgi:hypothetical protein